MLFLDNIETLPANFDYTTAVAEGAVLGTFATTLLGVIIFLSIISLATSILILVSWWKVFKKAGQPGWAAIVPIYNTIVKLQIAGLPEWYVLLILLVPIANIVMTVMMIIEIAHKFNKSTGFAIGMIFLPVIFLPILAFSNSEYNN